ncbi:MAG: acylneuraminate cytidylyltransferase [Flavobacteriaceae bacterium]|nr:acylneuraminate cytidylyltransferase [Flavobacteriaceae bacterium]
MKGESERIYNKNMRLFNGQPLCSIMLDKLCASPYIEKVIVNTDSTSIKEFIENRYDNVIVVDRPKHLLGHDVSMNKIIAHDINIFPADLYLQTHSTNPLLREITIDRAIEKFNINLTNYDSLFSVTRFQTRFYQENGQALNHNPEVLIKTQDLPVLYEENSCIYIFSKEAFEKNNRRIGKNPVLFEIEQIEAVDIDVEDEFVLAEKLHKVI